jgi:hypothetical protein
MTKNLNVESVHLRGGCATFMPPAPVWCWRGNIEQLRQVPRIAVITITCDRDRNV